jgi:nicotinamide-nucleotide amidase
MTRSNQCRNLLAVGIFVILTVRIFTLAAGADPISYAVVVTGDELLQGVYPDAHINFITKTLRPMGYECVRAVFSDDSIPAIKDALGYASAKVNFVIVTGGLGPTPNDVTRDAISEFTALPLEEHPAVLALISQKLNQSPDQLRPNLRRQAKLPKGGSFLKNGRGTAVGLVCERDTNTIIALPGPPSELQPMVTQELAPYLAKKFGLGTLGHILTLRFAGLGQSVIDQTIKQKVSLSTNVMVSSLFEGSRVDFSFALPANTSAFQLVFDQIERQVRDNLGANLYAHDMTTLEDQVLRRLKAARQQLSVVEIASKGGISAGLLRASDSSLVKGAFIFQQEKDAAEFLGLSPQQWNDADTDTNRLLILAEFAARKTGSQIALAVGQIDPTADAAAEVRAAIYGLTPSPQIMKVSYGKRTEITERNLSTLILLRFLKLLDPSAP